MRHRRDTSQAEARLRRALVREAVPDGFSARVMAAVRSEGRLAPAAKKPRWSLPRPSQRLVWAMGGCTCALALFFVASERAVQDSLDPAQVATHGSERDLAEVLQLAGSKWIKAQEAAFPPGLDSDDD